MDRRPYRRESEERRREDLIGAALDLVAEGGAQAATVRAIAQKAGVTPGLIRHYFASKDELTRAAYGHLMAAMTEQSAVVLQDAPEDPALRLALFIAAAVSPPVADPEAVALWAGFVHGVRRDAAMREVHALTYLAFRDLLQELIAALPQPQPPCDARAKAIACNALIDGLWMESGLLPEAFAPEEIVSIALHAAGAILGCDLMTPYQTYRNSK
jgi:TetR/AcrR family transcriptional regulator, transcriptional repressor of bet genes